MNDAPSYPEAPDAFILKRCQGRFQETPTVPYLFVVPHSGRYYPPNFLLTSQLSEAKLRQSEDAFVDNLYDAIPELGAHMLVATHARSYLDLNRAVNELEPDMFAPALEGNHLDQSPRVKAGLGTIPRIVAAGENIYNKPIPAREAIHRVQTLHVPFHRAIKKHLQYLKDIFGYAVLIDCHSMPSSYAGATGQKQQKWSINKPNTTDGKVILGNCWGRSCDNALTSMLESLMLHERFQVRRNVPYAGGFITKNYGNPQDGIHAIQIELCRSLYMDEENLELLPRFLDIKARLTKVFKALFASSIMQNAAE